MTVEQFVMAYGAEQDRLRALLPEGFASLRPVLRINAEVRDGKTGALEFNTAAEKADNRGWVNIGRWDDVPFTKDGKKDDLHAAGADDLVHRRRHRGRLPCGKGQRRLLLLERRYVYARARGEDHSKQGILRL